eukprot:GHUV01039146.1.p1 GENE.GHUV01039146.1~~GHUV01039146.1.p1  ORF type:complete len:208 (+),score=112.64 GHUV01039146.1:134-757(+)
MLQCLMFLCARCGKQYHRHKRSIDPNKHVCSRCDGRLVFLGKFSRDGKLLNTSTSGPVTPGAAAAGSKTPGAGGNVFSQYIKTHFASVKKEMPAGTPHKELMSRLASQYKQQKTAANTQQTQQQKQEEEQQEVSQQQQKQKRPGQQQQLGVHPKVGEAGDSTGLGDGRDIVELSSDSDSDSDAGQQQQGDPEDAGLLSFMQRLDLAG